MKFIQNNFHFISLTFLIFIFIYLAIIFRSSNINAFVTPDETVNYAYLVTFAKTNNFKIENKYYSNPELSIVRPRGFVPNGKYLVPAKFIGMSMYYGFVYRIIGEYVYLLTPIFAGFGILIMFLFVFLVSNGNNRVSLLSAIILAFFPPYFWWTRYTYLENIFGSVIFFFGFYLLALFFKKKIPFYLYVASALFGISCEIRPDYSIYVIFPLIIFLIAFYKDIGIKRLLFSISIFSLTLIPLLYFNYILYGNILITGTHYSLNLSETIPLGLQNRTIENLMINFNSTFILSSNMFLISLIGIFSLTNTNGNKYRKYALSYLIFVILGIIIFSYVLLSGILSNEEIIVNGSYVRYFLPMYICILPGLSILIETLSDKIKFFTIIVYILFSVSYLSSQVSRDIFVVNNYSNIKKGILSNTEANSIVILEGLDKILYPDRQVASTGILKLSDYSRLAADLINNLIKFDKSTPVYLYAETSKTNVIEVKRNLSKNGIYLKNTDFDRLYKVNTYIAL
jgi:hypothetical protein